MAKYNREFLVPYLKNVCALHLAQKKIDDRYSVLIMQLKHLNNGFLEAQKPIAPTDLSSETTLLLVGSIVGIIINIGIYSFDWDWLSNLLIFLVVSLPIVFLWIVCFFIWLKKQIEVAQKKKKYRKKLYEYNQAQLISQKQRAAKLPVLHAELKHCENEKIEIHSLIQNVYSSNIIPRQFRNIYAAVYLYDWFSTSRMDDLDMALNTFVLEQIKEKLDIIIENQSEQILNQCIIVANQQNALIQQEQYANKIYAKLDQITLSDEERNCYLSMIESNTAATAYFAAADYIKHIV